MEDNDFQVDQPIQNEESTATGTNQRPIPGFLEFYLKWLMPIGCVIAILSARWAIIEQVKQGRIVGIIYSFLTIAFYVFITIYASRRFLRKKPDAVFFTKYHAVLIFLHQSSILLQLLTYKEQATQDSLLDATYGPVVKLLWAVFIFVFMCSKIVKEIIPVESRHLDKRGKILFWLSIVIPVFLTALNWIFY